jgi:hypothetical protein
VRIFFLVIALSVLSFALAQPSCVDLIHAWEDATATALSYKDSIAVLQGERELFFQAGEHSRGPEGEKLREIVEERSALPFSIPRQPQRTEESDESAEDFCVGTSVSPQGNNWLIEFEDRQEDRGSLTDSSMVFAPYRDTFVPILMSGRFELKLFFIPVKGSFATEFSDWEFPLSYLDPRER